MENLGWKPSCSSLENIVLSASQWQESLLAQTDARSPKA